ncbi:MAG: DUF4974 domain-containing protein, partial [Bacteroidetes bacterium]
YGDEPSVNTTLLEGKVIVSRESGSPEVGKTGSLELKPGEQARLMENGELKIESNVDVNEVVAWTSGLFTFRDAQIENVMRQLVRWYNVEIVYEAKPKLLHYLEQTNEVHFKVDGRRIVVSR